jgi:phosphoribosyl-ATP pyrophosphohydrolase
MNDTLNELYEVIRSRKGSSEEGSYTAYLFREGLDKILKKIGEESSETIIAAKSLEAAPDDEKKRSDLENEVSDLLYHLLVMLAERDIPLENIDAILQARSAKTGNLKKFKDVDKNS